MARKSASLLPSRQRAAQGSWAAIGADTSMSSIAVFAFGYDAMTKQTKIAWADCRWTAENDYISRLADAARGHDLIHEVLKTLWVADPSRVFIAQEEPVPMGMIGKMKSSYTKQQCEVSGAFLGSLARYGWRNIWQINNAQWKATLRKEGVTIRKMPEGKQDVKEWAIQAYGVPDWPDLVKGKDGGKVPRPESGYGAKAKAVQPNDIYDAAAVAAWVQDTVISNDLLNSRQ